LGVGAWPLVVNVDAAEDLEPPAMTVKASVGAAAGYGTGDRD